MHVNEDNLTSVFFLDDLATSAFAASVTRKCTYSSGKVLTQFRGEASITGNGSSSDKSLSWMDQIVMKVKVIALPCTLKCHRRPLVSKTFKDLFVFKIGNYR